MVTYGVANDLFFSGHTAIAVFGAVELARLKRRWLGVLGCSIALFEVATVYAARALYDGRVHRSRHGVADRRCRCKNFPRVRPCPGQVDGSKTGWEGQRQLQFIRQKLRPEFRAVAMEESHAAFRRRIWVCRRIRDLNIPCRREPASLPGACGRKRPRSAARARGEAGAAPSAMRGSHDVLDEKFAAGQRHGFLSGGTGPIRRRCPHGA